MSFNKEVKDELLELWQKKDCCKLSEMLGILLFSTNFSDKKISFITNSQKQVDNYIRLSKKCLHLEPLVNKKSKNFEVYFSQKDIPYILNNFNKDIVFSMFRCEKCKNAFLLGAFLTGGIISNPTADYRLEFISKSEDISCLVYRLLYEYNLNPKMTIKNKKVCVYLKTSEYIEDFLTYLGATKSSLKLMNAKIIKDIKNNTNRITNFETANLKKSADSSAKHIEAIMKIEKSGRFNELSPELQNIALARKENIGMSLTEFGKLFDLSRSGIYHKLKKICDFAENI